MELRFLTTPCIIIESEKLGPKLFNTVKKLKSLTLNRCGHEKNPISGANCIKSIVKTNHYVVATQDRDLQDWIRRKAGIALLYLHQKVPIIDEPSEASRNFITQKSQKPDINEVQRLIEIKKKQGIIKQPTNPAFKKKKKKPSGPNPLSCKKKKSGIDEKLHKIKDKKIKKKTKKIALEKS
jgi:U3 small nucleolar RNA-associated protein 23